MRNFVKALMRPTPRRLLVFLLSFYSILFATRLNPTLTDGALVAAAGFASVYLGQSVYNEVKKRQQAEQEAED